MQFVTLNQISLRNESACLQFGGKASNLAILLEHGFPVPPGFVVPTSVFEQFMLKGFEEYPDLSPQEIIDRIEFDKDFVESLQNAVSGLSASRLAIRSSSTDEDSQTHSFAGLQQSVIGVDSTDIQACLQAVKSVWKSFYARERLLYPIQASLCAPVPAMAVIIQALIESEVAGVVFTSHPIEGNQTLLLNVSHGQGSNVVDGKSGESLCISKISQDMSIESECLNQSQLRMLTDYSGRIEKVFQKPQDIEFAFAEEKLWILQTRDIAQNTRNAPKTLYSNVNVGEALSGVCTPMTWSVGMSIADRGFETVFAMLGLKIPDGCEFVTTFNGHIYLNISDFLDVASQIPLIPADVFAKIAGIHSLRDYACALNPMSKSHFIRNLPNSLAKLIQIKNRLNHLDERSLQFEMQRDELLKRDLLHASSGQILQAFDQLNAIFYDCAFDMLSAGGAFLAAYACFSEFISHFGEDQTQDVEQYLVSGMPNVPSAAPGFELLKIAGMLLQYPELANAFVEEESFSDIGEFHNKISQFEGYGEFSSKIERFLEKYGARANQEAELANPRWREAPGFLYQVIRTHIKSGISSDADDIARNVSRHCETRTNEFKAMLSRSLRPVFRTLQQNVQKYACLREQWRAYIVDVLGIFRKYFLEISAQFVSRNLIAHPDDIFFLTYDEVLNGIKDPHSLDEARLAIAFRKARHEAYQAARILPDTFVTHPNQCSESNDSACGKVLYGLPASPGNVQAKVRVVSTLSEASALEYGEILVTASTDVAWTPLFLAASAILTERGGPLSHAFVVAREYGIPAVVSVPGLLKTLKTGDIVRISGQTGTVIIVESSSNTDT